MVVAFLNLMCFQSETFAFKFLRGGSSGHLLPLGTRHARRTKIKTKHNGIGAKEALVYHESQLHLECIACAVSSFVCF